MMRLASLPNVVVMTESISNLHSPLFMNRIDSTLCRLSETEKDSLRPDTVITLGGAIVSRHIKDWLRNIPKLSHWHIGISHTTIDCFKHLTMRINMDAAPFLSQLASAMSRQKGVSAYSQLWHDASMRASEFHDSYIEKAPWSDIKAMAHIFSNIPRSWNVHLSNGTPVRYAQLMDNMNIHRSECNRGVSGIDGCTSTALGSSAVFKGVTLLISGDMSFQYDISALSSEILSPRFKMIVICNGGGGIFRFIKATSEFPETEKYLAVGTNLPLSDLCKGYGISYFEADSCESLSHSFSQFVSESERPALLAIHTPPKLSADVLKGYFTGILPEQK